VEHGDAVDPRTTAQVSFRIAKSDSSA